MSVGRITTRVIGSGSGVIGPSVGIPSSGGGGPTGGLISWWDMTEASGNRADSHGSNPAVDINTVDQRTGPGGASTASDHLSNADERFHIAAPHGMGFDSLTSVSVCGWFVCDVSNIPHYIVHLGTDYNSPTAFDYQLRRNATTTATELRMGSTAAGRTSQIGATVANGVWAFFYFYYDADSGEMGLSINDGAVSSKAVAGTRVESGTTMYLGFAQPSYGMDGGLASIAVYDQVLDASVVTTLYNGGTRLLYADL